MRRYSHSYTISFIALLAITPLHTQATSSEELTTQARQIIQQFATQLKTTLQTGIKTTGAAGAIDSCKLQAPDIADQLSELNGWQVGRTSLKTRNPDNAPDDWETSTLQNFASQQTQGIDPATLEAYTILDTPEGRQFRYMKAIPTAAVCLNCHGSKLSPEVIHRLDLLYPQDQARDYHQGDIRGAFTLSKKLN